MKLQERYEAAFIGCAIGDALGMPVEGFKRAQIHKYVGKVEGFMQTIIVRDTDGNKISRDEFGKLGYYTDGLEKGEWTDDTISFLLLGESLGELGRFDLEDIARRRIEDRPVEEEPRPDETRRVRHLAAEEEGGEGGGE